eukprot:g29715.t1
MACKCQQFCRRRKSLSLKASSLSFSFGKVNMTGLPNDFANECPYCGWKYFTMSGLNAHVVKCARNKDALMPPGALTPEWGEDNVRISPDEDFN